MQRLEPRLFEFPNPPLVDFLERHRIEKMELLPAAPLHRHEVRRFEQREVLRHSLPRHVQVLAELPQRLPVMSMQPIQQLSPTWIGQRLEQKIRVAHCRDNMQAFACMSRAVRDLGARR